MKQCPQCKHIYADELKFCLSDGGQLISLPDSPEEMTIIRPSLSVAQTPQPVRQGVNPLVAYLSVGLFALLVGGAIVAWVKPDSNVSLIAKNENLTNSGSEISSKQNIKVTNYPESNKNNISNISVNSPKIEQTPLALDTSVFSSEVKAALKG